MPSERDLTYRSTFEQVGETYTRSLAQQDSEVGREAAAWLGEQEALRNAASSARRDAREEETLSIAREALANSRRANKLAISAMIIAAIAVISAAIIGAYISVTFAK